MDKNSRKGGGGILSELKHDIETSGYKASAIVLHNYMSNITKRIKKHVALLLFPSRSVVSTLTKTHIPSNKDTHPIEHQQFA